MENKSVKILSAKQISIQAPLLEEWMENPLSYNEDYVRAVDPDFKQFISAGDARRMASFSSVHWLHHCRHCRRVELIIPMPL